MKLLMRKMSNLFNYKKQRKFENFMERFYSGQSAILSSRANSQNFEYLWDAGVKIYSQWDEDGILDYICQKLSIHKPGVVEIGAGNFTECNSRFLFEFRNANVFAVDAREDLASTITDDKISWKSHLFHKSTWVNPENINDLIMEAKNKLTYLDIFSLDLDGNDYWILQQSNLNEFKVIIVEYNPIFGSEIPVSVPRDNSFIRTKKHFSNLYYGASLKAFIFELNKKGFTFIGTNRVGSNAFFIKNEFATKFNLKTSNLDDFTRWGIRESRDKVGNLTLLCWDDRLKLISDLPLENVESGERIKVDHLL
jgi:hypothetical protein